jgi:endonuclease YncB( thermonuclease family)
MKISLAGNIPPAASVICLMAHWSRRQYEGWGRIQRSNIRAIVVIVILACAAGYSAYRQGSTKYGYRHWNRPFTAPHGTITGRPWVIDGDTIDVDGARIRLEGIDAPETDQSCADAHGQSWPCGRAATRELKSHLASREVTCSTTGYDRYRRVLAVCSVAGDGDVNAWMVRQGWAIAYGYAGIYQAEQDAAQRAQRGIWAGNFLPPAEWRRRYR